MGEVQTLEQFREWIRSQCRKDVDPQFGDNMVAEFEKIIRADTIPREAVQAAVDQIRDCSSVLRREGYEPVGHDNALMHIANHTGVTPTEVPQ